MKTKQQITGLVKESNSIKLITFWDHLPPLLANIFSVLFATSIILELKDIVSGWVMVLLTVFISLFLIQNEITKVKQIRNFFAGNKNSLIAFSITFIISVALSTIGMYFYTNKSTEIKDNSEISKNIEINELNNKYQILVSNVYSESFENTKEYEDINKVITYWKGRNAATKNERAEIRVRVEKFQNDLILARNAFKLNNDKKIENLNLSKENEKDLILSKYDKNINTTKTNDFISYIFLTLILITEFMTIVLNKTYMDKKNIVGQYIDSKFAQKYLIASNMLTSLYLSAKDNVVNINMAKYGLNSDVQWEVIKEIYNNLIMLGILSEGEIKTYTDEKGDNKKILYNVLVMDETTAQKKLDSYFEKFFSVI
jgi:hypothetical protein